MGVNLKFSCSQGFLVFAYTRKCGQRSRCTHTMRAHTCVSVVVCVARKPRPCPSYSRRRDRNNCVHWRSLCKAWGYFGCPMHPHPAPFFLHKRHHMANPSLAGNFQCGHRATKTRNRSGDTQARKRWFGLGGGPPDHPLRPWISTSQEVMFCQYYGDVPEGGALSAVRAQCGHSATIWASSRTRDPYFVILGASLLPLA